MVRGGSIRAVATVHFVAKSTAAMKMATSTEIQNRPGGRAEVHLLADSVTLGTRSVFSPHEIPEARRNL